MIKYACWKRIILRIFSRYFFKCYFFLHPVIAMLNLQHILVSISTKLTNGLLLLKSFGMSLPILENIDRTIQLENEAEVSVELLAKFQSCTLLALIIDTVPRSLRWANPTKQAAGPEDCIIWFLLLMYYTGPSLIGRLLYKDPSAIAAMLTILIQRYFLAKYCPTYSWFIYLKATWMHF